MRHEVPRAASPAPSVAERQNGPAGLRLFLIVALQDEATGARPEDGDVAVQKLFETKRFIEAFGQIEILCGKERTGELCSGWNSVHLGSPFVET
jgi:hypothetical protein